MSRPLRIAMIGQRGVPATFGGIERHVEELGAWLAAEGHDVTVYCRSNYADERTESYRGMRLRYVSTVGTKHLDASVHSGLSTAHAITKRYDIIHFHALGPGLFSPLARGLSRARVVQTIHGLDDERSKWGGGASRVLRGGQYLSARVPHSTITVSRSLQEHYARRHERTTVTIVNGVGVPPRPEPDEIIRQYGLHGGDYLLYLGRFVPEKAPDLLLRAFAEVSTDARLVVAGGSSFTDDYAAELLALADRDERVILPGYVYGNLKDELYANAAAFVLPSLLEGLPLTLLEALSYGTPVIASDIGPHREVLGAGGPGKRLVPTGDAAALTDALQYVLEHRDSERAAAQVVRAQILDEYRWDRMGEETLAVYRSLLPDA